MQSRSWKLEDAQKLADEFQLFELERGKHDQARLPSRTHGLQYPARVSPLTLIVSFLLNAESDSPSLFLFA